MQCLFGCTLAVQLKSFHFNWFLTAATVERPPMESYEIDIVCLRFPYRTQPVHDPRSGFCFCICLSFLGKFLVFSLPLFLSLSRSPSLFLHLSCSAEECAIYSERSTLDAYQTTLYYPLSLSPSPDDTWLEHTHLAVSGRTLPRMWIVVRPFFGEHFKVAS